MAKMVAAFTSIKTMLKENPAMVAALLNAAVALAAHFGFNVTPDQLVGYVVMANLLLGYAVRANVVPLAKLDVAIRPKVSELGFQLSAVLEIPGFPKPTSCQITTAHNPVPLRFVLHHIQPHEAGGPTVAENLANVCDSCHYSTHRIMWEMAKGQPLEKAHRNIVKLAKRGYDACVAAGTVENIPNEG